MIWPGFTKANRRLLFLLLVLAVGTVFRLSQIPQRFQFDYDQQVPAQAAYDFFERDKISLIGQELSFPGLFLGPLHNWIQFIPYGFCNLLPDCVPYFFGLVGLVTAVIIFLVLKQIFGVKVGAITATIYFISQAIIGDELGPDSNYFLPLASTILLFAYYKYHSGKNNYLPPGAFVAGLATVNFNPVFIFTAAAFFAACFLGKKFKAGVFVLALLAFTINFLPLIIFNARHDNLLGQSILNFTSRNVTVGNPVSQTIFLVKDVALPFFNYYLFNYTNIVLIAATAVLILLGLKIASRESLFLVLWIPAVILGFIFYRGHIPDYYFGQALIPMFILVALVVSRHILLLASFLAFFLFFNLAYSYSIGINYQLKKSVIKYIVNDSGNVPFNVYFDMPPGFATGYNYLFKGMKHQPQEDAANLYILEIPKNDKFDMTRYYKAFPDKQIESNVLGLIYLVSIKPKT